MNVLKVVRAEILPRDSLQTLGNYYLSLTIAKFKVLKNVTVKNSAKFREIINFQEQNDFPPRDFDEILQTAVRLQNDIE